MAGAARNLWAVLNNPASIRTAGEAKQLHARVIKLQPAIVSFPDSSAAIILSIYTNFSLLQYCLSLFNSFRKIPPKKAWKSMIKCCASTGNSVESVAYFNRMRTSGITPDPNVFPLLLKACADLGDFRLGRAVHGCVVRHGVDGDLFTGNSLMNMYSKLEPPMDARNVFDEMPQQKRKLRFKYNGVETYVGSHLNENEGDSLENCLDFNGSEKKFYVRSRDELDSVSKIFEAMPVRDVVSWNTVIRGLVQNRISSAALSALKDMVRFNVKPDSFTLSTVLPIIARNVDIVKGKEIHGYAVRCGFDKGLFMGSSLIDMYANCNRPEDSYCIFAALPLKDSVSWNSMVAAWVQNGRFDDGLKLFREMLAANFKPVAISFSSIMPACAHLTTMCLGKQLHGYIIRWGFEDNIYVASSLVDIYAKCGSIKTARWIFDKMEFHDAFSLTAMIMAYATHGQAHDAVLLFEKMSMEGVEPNSASFLAVLTACSHAGLVDTARGYFASMVEDYGIHPQIEHYAAVSDVFSRAGRLDEAYEFIRGMDAIKPTVAIWSTLLSSCRVHKKVELAEKVAGEMLAIDPRYVNAYVLLSNVYTAAGRWKDATKMRMKMRNKGMKKEAACSWIEVRYESHVFASGDESHPDYDRINEALQVLTEQIEHKGCVLELIEDSVTL
ncbi:putative pentatricopeptide repeat-containing protein At3g23330 [Andrographis paniculata]|uniref:putative pentatricopeptide repeat-containing protein At3g23330 n=1 Tax=Andrographis paniculata TaxID=175694 RepID=UPI0021E78DB0|nr:putative pentatricopeptide repeat-containing protein At3g23330 [Andrographis paniculata]